MKKTAVLCSASVLAIAALAAHSDGRVPLLGDGVRPVVLMRDGKPCDYGTSLVPTSSAFSVELVFRFDGWGSLEGNPGWRNGMLFCCDSGYYEGFRLLLHREDQKLPNFEIGRAQGSVSLEGPDGVTTGVWHHVVVVRDPAGTGLVYLDGTRIARQENLPEPVFKGGPIRLGFVGYGVGSLDRLQFADAAYWPRALTADEVLAGLKAARAGREADFAPAESSDGFSRDGFIGRFIPNPVPERACPPPTREERGSGWERIDVSPADWKGAETLQRIIDRESASGEGRKIEIRLAPGTYAFNGSVTLRGARHRWAFVAASAQKPVLTGGKRVAADRFDVIRDASGRMRAEVEMPRQRPFGVGIGGRFGVIPFAVSRVERTALKLAAWPNEGYVKTARKDGVYRPEGAPVPAGKEFLAHGYWKYDWADAALVCRGEADGVVRLSMEHNYGFADAARLRLLGAAEFVDLPDEWASDGGCLWTMEPKRDVVVPQLTAPFFVVEDGAAPVFESLSFESGCTDALVLRRTPEAQVRGCEFFAVGGLAVAADGCEGIVIDGCDIGFTGFGGVSVAAGDRRTLRPGRTWVRGCRIHDISLLTRTYTPAVLLVGCGNRVCGNRFERMPSSAMRVEGNDNLVCHNVFQDTVLESDDQGAIDMWGDPTRRGNHFAYNLFKDVGGGGATGCGRAGIRFDDMISGNFVYGNVFDRASRGNFGGVQIHGGQHNRIVGNDFVDCSIGVSFSPWGAERWLRMLDDAGVKSRAAGLERSDLYLSRYPDLRRLKEDADANFIAGNRMIRCDRRFKDRRPVVEAFSNPVID